MDDNIKNPGVNQSLDLTQDQSSPPASSTPIFESVPVEENVQPEELPPEVSTPSQEEVGQPQLEQMPGPPLPPSEESRSKYLVVAAAGVIFVLILFLVLKAVLGRKKSSASVKLIYWGLWEEKEVFDPLIVQYQKENPRIVINYQKMAVQEYKDRLLARSIKGAGPDIFRFHNTWLPEIKDVVTRVPPSIISKSEYEKTFYKIHQRDLKVGNDYYGIPLMIDGLVLIYNEELLKKAGIETPPVNWDEMTEAISKLTVKDGSGQIITAGIALGTATNVEHYSDIFGLMLLQNGGDLQKLDQPEAAGALESYRKFAEPPNDFWNEAMPNSIVAFAQERVAMIIAPSWQMISIKAVNPDMTVKAAPVPSVPGGKPVSLASYWSEGVSRYSKNQLEAWKFLKFLSEKENMAKLYQVQSQLRPFGEAYSRVDMAPLLTQNQYLGAVTKQADYYVSLPLSSRTFDNGLNDEIIKYIENAINATSQGSSYGQALENAKKGVDQILVKYKIE